MRVITKTMTRISKKIEKMKESIERKQSLCWKKKSETSRVRAKVRFEMTKMLKFAENLFQKLTEDFHQELIRIFATKLFLETTDTREKPLAHLWKEFKATKPGLRLSLRRFREIIHLLEYDFRVSRRVFRKKPLHPQISFQAFSEILHTLAETPNSLFFFDCSSFVFELNPKRAWQHASYPTQFFSSTNYKRHHLMMVVSTRQVFAYQVVLGKSSSFMIQMFLREVIERIRAECPSEIPKIVLDNATVHKTLLMKGLARSTGASFIFTAAHSPFMNPIELCFRFLKAKFRNRHFISE